MWTSTTIFDSLIFQAVLASIASIFILSWIVKAPRRKRTFPLPPGPRGLPLLGYLPFLGTDPHVTFANLSKVYGPIFKVQLGNKLHIVLSSPELVKEVVRDKDIIFANRGSGVASNIATYEANDIAFRDYGPEWRKLRKIFAHKLLGNSTLEASFGFRREAVKVGVKEIYRKIGTPVDIGKVGFMTAINGMMGTIWGGSADGAECKTDLKELLDELMVLMAAPNVSDYFPTLAWLDLQGIEARSKRVFNEIDVMFDDAIAQIQKTVAENPNQGSLNFLEYLMGLKDENDSATSISLTQIKAMLMDVAVGGTDTTSTLFEWTLSELLLHPQVLKVVQDELTEVVGLDKHVTELHLPKLSYLGAVVKEAHRLHTAIPLLLPRCPSQETQVGNYTVPKGVRIFINAWAIHRDPAIWENPLEFKPERFLKSETKWDFSGQDLRYIPFGCGRRMCPGLPMAERSLMYTLATCLHCFNWEVPEGVKIELGESFGIVMKKKKPLVAIPSLRLANTSFMIT
ncbi:unnamed protein product [Rhodiola kirilowii]